MSDITRSPLCWPTWFPRTKASDRTMGRFGKKNKARGWGIEKLRPDPPPPPPRANPLVIQIIVTDSQNQ